MPDSVSSPALLLALSDLDRTDGKALVKSAVKELVARRVLTLEALDGQRGSRRPQRRLVLIEGPEPMPQEPLLATVAQLVARVPSEITHGRVVRDLALVARHLAREAGVRRELVEVALRELVSAGLARTEERKVLGVVKRTVHVRTPAGEAALSRAARLPRLSDGVTGGEGVYVTGGGDLHEVDDTFDSGSDPSFDSSFDSGAGAADGGGGEGGGGGGGGGD